MDTADKLNALKELCALREADLLSEDEFNLERRRIVASSPSIWSALGNAIKQMQQVAWPLVALIILFTLKQPLISKLLEAEQFSVGSFSLKVHERAVMTGNPELANSLSGLSQRAIELLMDTGDKNMRVISRNEKNEPESLFLDKVAYAELDAKGLLLGPEPYTEFIKWAQSLPGKSSIRYKTEYGEITFLRPDQLYTIFEAYDFSTEQLAKEDRKRLLDAAYTLSDKGRQVWRLIAKVVSEQLSMRPVGNKQLLRTESP
jgi:hypothetical protein